MPRFAILTGLVLIGLGLVGYFVVSDDDPSVTALIPAFFGLPIALAGAVALKESARKHAMHAAAALGLLGLLAPLGRIIPVAVKGELELAPSTVMLVTMALICLVFEIACVRSFVAARRAGAV